jgi:SAM-dependent methyltransferase
MRRSERGSGVETLGRSRVRPGAQMTVRLRDYALRTLPPVAIAVVRSGRWYFLFYLPRLFKSWTLDGSPAVTGFAPNTEELITRLRRANVFSPTRMCRVMRKHGSDKGTDAGSYRHNYTAIYSKLFSAVRRRPLRMLEVGIGTNNPELASTMGVNGKPGASLRGWRELFPRALIFGADIDRSILFQEERIETFYCDQMDPAAIRDLWSRPQLRDGMDIIIDDGLHTFEANTHFLERSLECLRPGGFYIIEDILRNTLRLWRETITEEYLERYPGFCFALVELPHPANDLDNNLLVIYRLP